MTAKLGLGTVQWGIPYGVANRSGMTSEDEVSRILAKATALGVDLLDTAAGYGRAEAVLGRHDLSPFRVVTKTPSFKSATVGSEQARAVEESLRQSLLTLRLSQVYGLLVHHADDLLVSGGDALIAILQGLKAQGLVRKIGVSIYQDEQLEEVLARFIPDIVQLPLNVLDQRLIINGRLQQLKGLGVEIHVRSVFLQGLLLMDPADVPSHFAPISPLLKIWHERVREQGMSPVQAALSFVRDLPWVDIVLTGVDSSAQFCQCAEDFVVPGSFDASGLGCNDPAFVNPAEWKLK
ncbi:MAG TPA: aldo/keto reductase [Azospira sp.]|nr:aldo/keto reductase [Azospira sp.]